MTKKKTPKQHLLVVGIRILAFILMGIGLGAGGPLLLLTATMIAPIRIMPKIYGKKLKASIGRIAISLVLGGFLFGLARISLKQDQTPEARFEIITTIPELIETTSYNIELKVENVETVKFNDESISVQTGQETVSYEVQLDSPETHIKITASNTYRDTGMQLTLTRNPTPEEIKAQEELELEEQQQAEAEQNKKALADMKMNPEKYLEITSNDWYKGGFDSIGMHTITIKNNAKVDYKDILIQASYFSKSETNLGNNRETIYEIIPAGQTKTFKEVNFGFIDGQASSSVLKVIRAELVE